MPYRPITHTLLRGPVEPKQYVSFDYTQELNDHQVLASVGTVGDAYDNAMAESFVDSFKTELIKDRVWHSNSQLELAVVEWVGWYNNDRLHSRLGNRPPAEIKAAFTTENGARAHSWLARTAPTEQEDEQLATGLSAAQ